MRANFSVEVDVGRSLLTIHLEGFFSKEDVRLLAAQRNAAAARLRCPPNQHITLCDARGSKLSTPEVTEEFQRLLGDPKYKSRRLAYVVEGALGRMQANRVLARADIAFFEERAPALEWLLRADDAATAAPAAGRSSG